MKPEEDKYHILSLTLELWCQRRLLRVPWLARMSSQSILKESALNIPWKDRYWSWSSNILATWCRGPTHWETPWCWERLKPREKGTTGWGSCCLIKRGWEGWMEPSTQWTWVWENSRRWWMTGKPGMLQPMGWQRVGNNLATEQQQQYVESKVWHKWIFLQNKKRQNRLVSDKDEGVGRDGLGV